MIELKVTLPNGATPTLTIADGQMGTIRNANGSFGFTPHLEAQRGTQVVNVAVRDLQPGHARQLTRVDLQVGGGPVSSHSSPEFQLQILRVVPASQQQ